MKSLLEYVRTVVKSILIILWLRNKLNNSLEQSLSREHDSC